MYSHSLSLLSCLVTPPHSPGQVRHKIDRFKEEQLHLNQQMNMYSAAGSTPGSTPSSSVVNINDVGQLPLELNVPHINEPDAASARATVSQLVPTVHTVYHIYSTEFDYSFNWVVYIKLNIRY